MMLLSTLIYKSSVEKQDAIEDIEQATALTLMAKKIDGTINGYLEIKDGKGNYEVTIYLYTEDKEPDYREYKYKGGDYYTGKKSKEKTKEPNKNWKEHLKLI